MGANCGSYPLIYTVLDFNLAQNNVGVQVNAGKKVTPTDPMPMGVATERVAIVKRAPCSPQRFFVANTMPRKSPR